MTGRHAYELNLTNGKALHSVELYTFRRVTHPILDLRDQWRTI
jgi:hypothetical protein